MTTQSASQYSFAIDTFIKWIHVEHFPCHTSLTHYWQHSRDNLAYSILPEDTLAREMGWTGFELPTLWLVYDPLWATATNYQVE